MGATARPADPLLAGQTAIVTGAARGIGLATARELAGLGARVVISDIDEAAGHQSARELNEAGLEARFARADVTRPADCAALADLAAAWAGDIDILVNNAGLMRRSMIHRMTDEAWDTAIDVSLRGTFNCLRAVAPWFRSGDKPRRVVNISSVAGIYGNVGSANYAAAKAGIIGLTKSVAHEWARFGVTVNAVAPGFVSTRITEAADDPSPEYGVPAAVRERMIAMIPVGRAGTPEDIAAAVGYLCSPKAGFVTGIVLEVNGGLTLTAVPPADLPHGDRRGIGTSSPAPVEDRR